MKMKKKKKSGPNWGRDPESQLLKAATRYIESKGGKVIVIGGLEIQTWPLDQKFNFKLAIRFTGLKPQKPQPHED